MISRRTTRRLEAIEARLAPSAELMIVQIVYVTPDGTTEAGPQYEIPMHAPGHRRLPGGSPAGPD